MTEIKLGGISVAQPGDSAAPRRMAIILWGASKCGKSTLAATAPGKKLWITFDQDATVPLAACPDEIVEADFSGEPVSIAEKFKEDTGGVCRDLDKLLAADDEIETVVVDSLTTFGDKALQHGVVKAQGTKKGAKSTLEDPGLSGWGNKNTWMRLLVSNINTITRRHNRHVIFIAHEDKPTTDSGGNFLFISIMIGSSLQQSVPINLSEVWHMEIAGSKSQHRIQIRPARGYKPMGTRMFKTTGPVEFNWNFDPDTWKGEGIADWYARWKEADYKKISLPGEKEN